jgi:hypothetical protein
MNPDLERILARLTPRGTPDGVRARILKAVAQQLSHRTRVTGAPWGRAALALRRVLGLDSPVGTSHEVEERPMRRFRVLKVGGAVLALLVAASGLSIAGWAWSNRVRFDGRVETVRAADDPVTLRDLARPAIPPEKNAAVFLRRAREGIKEINKELSPLSDSPTFRSGRLTEAERKAAQAVFAAHPNVLPLLEQAAACPDCNWERDYSVDTQTFMRNLLDEVQESREYVRVLTARARLLAATGKRPEALHACLLIFRLARHQEREPSLIVGHLVVNALRAVGVDAANVVLRSGPLPEAARGNLEKELALSDSLAGFQKALKAERAYGTDSFNSFMNWVNRLTFYPDQCFYLDVMQEQIALCDRPYAEAAEAFRRYHMRQGKPTLNGLVIPALAKARDSTERIRAQMRSLRVLNALQRVGATEPKLTGLGLPAEATTDPFTDSPLHVKKVSGDWLIYSVGVNLTDDGGDLEENMDVGVGPLPQEAK